MNRQQHGRWHDFARRMATTAFVGRQRPDAVWIAGEVEDLLAWLDRPTTRKLRSWDGEKGVDGMYLCDWMSERCSDLFDQFVAFRRYRPPEGQAPPDPPKRLGWDHPETRRVYAVQEHHATRYAEKADAWDDRDYEQLVGYSREMLAFRQFEAQWWGPVACCIRAGLDVACEPSGGVLGFDLGDLRRMYPEGVPDWLAKGWADPEGQPLTPEAFRSQPETAGIWL